MNAKVKVVSFSEMLGFYYEFQVIPLHICDIASMLIKPSTAPSLWVVLFL